MVERYLEDLVRTVKRHEDWRLRECLNLDAAENRGSRLMNSMFLSDLGNRYTDPEGFHRGSGFLEEIQSETEELAKKVFQAKFADIRPLSGHIADLIVLMSLTVPGDSVVSVSSDNGGYPGINSEGLGTILGLGNHYFPYDKEAVNIEREGSATLLNTIGPKVVFFGSSFIPFPHPTKELTGLTRGTCVYDGSHVLGLIAGGQFQDPLREGCSLLIGSTHKSFPGPQGGIILSDDEEAFSKATSRIYPGIVDNIHLNRVAALAVALIEMKKFGRSYSRAVVRNSQVLAKALAGEGVRVRGAAHGYTKSHQVLLDYDADEAKKLSRRLEKANIIADDGGRLGTSELTRMGYGPDEMREISSLVALVVLHKKSPAEVAPAVRSLAKRFREPKYVLR